MVQENYINSFDNSGLSLRVILKFGNKKWIVEQFWT